jgi:hypothetical protein
MVLHVHSTHLLEYINWFGIVTFAYLKPKVNLTINPKIYQAFKEATAKSLQPKSWVIERMMKRYITETNK